MNSDDYEYKIGVLGPHGTCTEQAGLHYLAEQFGQSDGAIFYDTFEHAIRDTVRGAMDFAVVPAAYPNLNDIYFSNLGEIKVPHIFVMETPGFALAAKNVEALL